MAIEIELVGGPCDGQRTALPGDPPPLYLMPALVGPVTLDHFREIARRGPVVAQHLVYERRMTDGYPSLSDAGIYHYDYRGLD